MNIVKALCACFLSLCMLSAQADSLDHWVVSFEDQTAAVDWIMEHSLPQAKMTLEKARTIVSTVYAESISKDLDPDLVFGVIAQESRYDPLARSKAGAKGLMQVLPKWHKDKLNGRNLYAAKVNIEVGTEILKDCLTKHRENKKNSLACYSGGARNYYQKVVNYQKLIRKYIAESTRARTILLASN